jgi:uncharacterized protein YsxB (DUF464 family)
MIVVEAVLDSRGALRSVVIRGHAGAGPKGGDVVCAAVSVLAKALLRTLSGREGIAVRGDAPERGAFALEAALADGEGEGAAAADAGAFLAAAGAFFLEGVKSVSEEYPDCCRVKIRRK